LFAIVDICLYLYIYIYLWYWTYELWHRVIIIKETRRPNSKYVYLWFALTWGSIFQAYFILKIHLFFFLLCIICSRNYVVQLILCRVYPYSCVGNYLFLMYFIIINYSCSIVVNIERLKSLQVPIYVYFWSFVNGLLKNEDGNSEIFNYKKYF